MITIDEKEKCTGCGACYCTCPTRAIKMLLDEEGFWYPQINKEACIQCGKCNSVCHFGIMLQVERMCSAEYYAAYDKSQENTFKASSGGIFWLLVESIIKSSGVVYGAYQEDVFRVKHGRAEKLSGCKKFRKSKYLESYLGNIYSLVKKDVINGKNVLFSGTPCQLAGLYSYLGRDYENLFTCDVVCHSVPSSKVFRKYIKETEKLFHDKVSKISFRDKRIGWKENLVTIHLQRKNKNLSMLSWKHPFHEGYLKGLYSRPSCRDCKYASLPRQGDISLADYWECGRKIEKENQNRGVSLVILNSMKGKRKFDEIKHFCSMWEVSEDNALRSCWHLTHAPKISPKREFFMKDIEKFPFHYIIRKYLRGKT